VIARQHGDLPGALKENGSRCKRHPQHVLGQVELGTLFAANGDLDRARQALEQAVSISPNVPENHYQLGLAYSRLGFRDKAQVQMQSFRNFGRLLTRPSSTAQIPAILKQKTSRLFSLAKHR